MTDGGEAGVMPMDLLFVRHGQSEGNLALDRAKAGDLSLMTDQYRNRSTADDRLSELGRRQAAQAGSRIRNWLASVGEGAGFDRMYCSPFARTRAAEAGELDLDEPPDPLRAARATND